MLTLKCHSGYVLIVSVTMFVWKGSKGHCFSTAWKEGILCLFIFLLIERGVVFLRLGLFAFSYILVALNDVEGGCSYDAVSMISVAVSQD